jgi:hypothetical protein
VPVNCEIRWLHQDIQQVEVPDMKTFVVLDCIFVLLVSSILFNLKYYICMAGGISYFIPTAIIAFVFVVEIIIPISNLKLQKVVVSIRRILSHSYISCHL